METDEPESSKHLIHFYNFYSLFWFTSQAVQKLCRRIRLECKIENGLFKKLKNRKGAIEQLAKELSCSMTCVTIPKSLDCRLKRFLIAKVFLKSSATVALDMDRLPEPFLIENPGKLLVLIFS